MKGPKGRSQLDVRRIWRCPECGTEIKMDGDTAQKICKCQKEGHWMKLVSEPVQKRVMSGIQLMIDKEYPDHSVNYITNEDQTTQDNKEES